MNARLLASLAAASFVFGSNVGAEETAGGTEERVTRNAAGHVREHAADELRESTSFEYLRRQPDDIAVKPRAAAGSIKGSQKLLTSGESWIYDARTDLFGDADGDGYYRFIRVQLDADTVHTYAEIYAEIYLSADGNAWELLYATNDFSIWRTDDDDDYEVETELVSGYPAGVYDVLVEIYDAETGEFLDDFGPEDSDLFSMQPLEDSGRDGLVVELPAAPTPAPVTVIHEEGGGGAVSWLTLTALAGVLALRRRRLTA